MKKKRNNGGIWAAMAAVLLITALVLGCSGPSDDWVERGGETLTPDPGMGFLWLNINGSNSAARTLFPNDLGINDVEDFTHFELVLTYPPAYAAYNRNIEDIDPADIGDPIQVRPGLITVTLLGYYDGTPMSPGTPIVVASGTDIVTILEGDSATADIVLGEVVTGGHGRFVYNLTVPAGVELAEMEFLPLSGQTSVPSSVDLLAANTGNVELGSGFWRVITTLGQIGYQTAVHRETVHIFRGHDTEYNFVFPLLNSATHTVRFWHLIDDEWEIAHTANVPHNSVIPDFEDIDYGVSPGYLYEGFLGWYRRTGGTFPFDDWGDRWLATETVLRDTDLFARWQQALQGTLNLNVSVQFSDNPDVPAVTYSATGRVITLTIDNAAALSGIAWFLNGAEIDGSTPGVTLTTDSLTFDFDLDPELNIAGTQIFTVEAMNTAANRPVSRNIEVIIE